VIDVVEVVGPLWGRWGGNQRGGAKATQDSLAEELGGWGGEDGVLEVVWVNICRRKGTSPEYQAADL
jgi:hypothetical protein